MPQAGAISHRQTDNLKLHLHFGQATWQYCSVQLLHLLFVVSYAL
jgi:hypothetical protein